MKPICIDIETLPTDNPEVIAEIAARIKPPSNYTKADTIAKWEAESKPAAAEAAVRATALDGTYGRICCIGYACQGEAPAVVMDADESEMLRNFQTIIFDLLQGRDRTAIVIGHNVVWDLRFLWQRYVINGLKRPLLPWNAKPWDGSIYDTMQMWNPDREKRVSLNKLCRALGVPTPKGDMDGSKVYDSWKAGEYQKIVEYCAGDVDATLACYERMRG